MARSATSRISARFTPVLVAGGLLLFAGAGCVSQEDYTALQMANAQLSEQLATANAEAKRNKAIADQAREMMARMEMGDAAGSAQLTLLQQQIAALQNERNEWMTKYQGLVGKIGETQLPELLISELTQFATANPELVDFDAVNGIVKFKSDVTFASGDAELTSEARAVIQKFGQILNGQIAKNYRLEIAGHTDNVPVESALTKSKGHKDNWYLSSHRAISVAETLRRSGVADSRIGVTGYADQRPVASNTSPSGRQQNRRVEVLILPFTVTQTPMAEVPAQPDAETAGAPADVPAK